MSDDQPTVLIIDDEPDLADLYAAWLDSEYEVRTAYGGEAGLADMDKTTDVALIDRLMPDLSGDEALDRIRDEEYECRVAMVTAVEPDFDIIEMGFDDYLVKPVRREELNEAVQDLSDRAAYGERLREYYALSSKRATLDTQKSQRELDESEAYAELVEEIEQMSDELDEVVANFSPEEFEAELRKIDDG